MNNIKCSLIALGCALSLPAMAAPLYTIQLIHTPPSMVVAGQEAIATYKVSTQLSGSNTVIQLPATATHIVDGETQDCASPNFTLTPSTSCLLHLKISALNLPAGQSIVGAPLIANNYQPGKNPSLYTPIPNGINTQVVDATNAQLPTLKLNTTNLTVTPGSTSEMTITNLSPNTEVNNLQVILPESIKTHVQTTTDCTYLAANQSCKITFNVDSSMPATGSESIVIQAANSAPYTVTMQNVIPPNVTVALSPAASKHLQYQAIEVKNISDKTISLVNIDESVSDETKISICKNTDAVCEQTCTTGETLTPNQACFLWFHALDATSDKSATIGKQTENISVKVVPSYGDVVSNTFNLKYNLSLYIGGSFTKNAALSQSYNHIANWDGKSLTAFNAGLGNSEDTTHDAVYALAMYRGDLYAAGDFATTYNHIARWDVATQSWQGLTPNGTDKPGLNEHVHALAVLNDELYAGGSFTSDNNNHRLGYITHWNGKAWASMPYNDGVGVNGPVHALFANGTDLYVGGQFNSTANGVLDLNHVARWDAANASWHTLQETDQRAPGVYGDTVRAFTVIGNTLYLGGSFSYYGCDGALNCRVSRQMANNILGWDLVNHTWQTFPAEGLNDVVIALASQHNALFAGGEFTETGDGKTSLSLIGLFTGNSWTSLTANAVPSLLNPYNVNALSVLGNQLYAGGQFVTATDKTTTLNNIAFWNGNVWQALATGDDQVGFNASVQALMVASSISWE